LNAVMALLPSPFRMLDDALHLQGRAIREREVVDPVLGSRNTPIW
jgi:hypothetical protein